MDKILFDHILPENYTPYKSLNFCSNILIDVRNIFEDDGFYPLLIGKGENNPLVWLFLRTKEKAVITIVEENRPLFNQFNIDLFEKDRILLITVSNNIGKTSVIEINYNSDVPRITHFDLRPLGYSIYGDFQGLNIGTSKYSGNTIQALTFMRFSNK